MKDLVKGMTWREAEWLFNSSGQYSHIYSTPLESGYIFENDDERKYAILSMALAAEATKVIILAYALMTNHFHFIVKGDNGKEFFMNFRDRMSKYLSRHGRPGLLDDMVPGEKIITSLGQFYNELAYVIRNPYVVSTEVNMFSYQWCSGFLYFNDLAEKIPFVSPDKLSYRELRKITKSRDTVLPSWIRISEGCVNPVCFVDYKLVERLFRNPQEYLSSCLKNVEAQVQVAISMNEKPVLTDDEMYRMIRNRMDKEYRATDYKLLSAAQRTEVLKYMKYELAASNGQIARVLHLRQADVDAIFPQTAKNRLAQ